MIGRLIYLFLFILLGEEKNIGLEQYQEHYHHINPNVLDLEQINCMNLVIGN